MNDPEDYQTLIAALPAEHEIDLTNSEALSTAFYAARRKGWTVDQLVNDAVMTIGRGGVGMVLTRFRGLSQHSPVTRGGRQAPPPRYQYENLPRLPDRWVEERTAVLHRIAAERPDPETAAQWMRDVINEQRSGEDGAVDVPVSEV